MSNVSFRRADKEKHLLVFSFQLYRPKGKLRSG